MKVRRKSAKPYDGTQHIPYKLRVWMEKHPEHQIVTGTAVFPVCEGIQWMKHGDHKDVHQLAEDHPHTLELRAQGLQGDFGHCENQAGHLGIVLPGDHLVDYPGGLVHHCIDAETFARAYEAVE